ncbi:MAG: hypothetical protein IH989_04605 [Planctomycetes bacterium]|nr:hypothetical protein [Planctomycetota bacterium]
MRKRTDMIRGLLWGGILGFAYATMAGFFVGRPVIAPIVLWPLMAIEYFQIWGWDHSSYSYFVMIVGYAMLGGLIGLVADSIRRKDSAPGRCQACDYDLTGNVSGVCPECGTKVIFDN